MRSIAQTFCLVTAITLPASAQAENITLNLYAYGLKAGTILINGAENSAAYSVKGLLSPSRLLKTFKDVGYTGSAAGTIRQGAYFTRRYSGHARTGSRNSIVKMHWNGASPFVDRYSPERDRRDYDITPFEQTGTKDLLTAAYITFKTVISDELCNTTHDMFDGRRRSKISLDAPKISGNTAICTCGYKRISGFSTHQMQKGVNFPFTMRYERQDDGTFRFQEFTSEATFGKIRAIRK
mgnify:CR=1 FL=1